MASFSPGEGDYFNGEVFMIHVVATIESAAGKRDELLAAFRALVPQVRAEAGCVEYQPAVDVDSGIAGLPPTRGDVVTVVEKWASLQALRDHLASPHMLQFLDQVSSLVVGREIRTYQSAE
jgi:quinol monooxygenase YgiN